MRKFPAILCACTLGLSALSCFTSCNVDDNDSESIWERYTTWREANQTWLDQQEALKGADGKPRYTRVVPDWNKDAYVLMRWINDPATTSGNLRPLYTSTVDVRYIGRLYDDTPFDSSYLSTSPAEGVARMKLNSVIPGWVIAMEQMHCGDSVEVLIPYAQGYGSATSNSKIPPFSVLRFNIRLVDVAGEYIRP